MRIEATFVRSAADAGDVPDDGLPRVALVGRSNVGKSSLINALVRQRVARTSAAPGMTRLANLYRVARPSMDAGHAGRPFYLIDLPGYGYARGGRKTAQEFEALTASLFGQAGQVGRVRQVGNAGSSLPALPAPPAAPALLSALLIVDARHPGLENDRAAWEWMKETVAARAIVATKIDKLARGQRIRALAGLESVFAHPVAAVSAETGEGLNELWKLIARLTKAA